jgi:putative intracellular protease/amidase
MRISILPGSSLLLSLAAAPLPASRAVAAPVATIADPTGTALVVPPPKAHRTRPLIAVIADKAGAQTTDFIVPYGILKDSGVADVRSLSTGAGPIKMTRGLRIMADESAAQFDAREPGGADIVIVPAQAQPKSPALVAWLRGQAARGATIISVCEGARVLAHAGLLDGKRATSHWASLGEMTKAYRHTIWLRDRRYVQDGSIITTAGVTASIPMSLALVEAIGGRAAAETTAGHFGVRSWGPGHRTADFEILPSDRAAAAQAQRAPHETTEIPIADGVDEVALGLQTEAWGRSMRTNVLTTHVGKTPIRSLHGLIIVPDAEAKAGDHVLHAPALPALADLDATLAEIGARYGPAAIRFAVLAMEYDRQHGGE